MADNIDDAGMKKLVLHIPPDEKVALWAHQGDDDLPDATALKRDMAQGRPRKNYHRGHLLQVWATGDEMRRLRRIQKNAQMSFAEWFRHALAMSESIRPSEAKDYVRKIIPEAVAVIAERELAQAGETLMAVANRQADWEAKRNLRADAGVIMDAAAWFTDVRKEYERLSQSSDRR